MVSAMTPPNGLIEIKGAHRSYWIRPPLGHDRSTWRRNVVASGGRRVIGVELLNLMERGVLEATQDGDEGRETALSEIAQARERIQGYVDLAQNGELDDMPEDEARQALTDAFAETPAMTDLAALMRKIYRPYAEAVADTLVYWEIAGREAVKLFLIEADGLEIKRGLRGLPDSVADQIPAGDLQAIGARVQNLVEVPREEKKGSGSSIAGVDGPKSSDDASTQPKTSP